MPKPRFLTLLLLFFLTFTPSLQAADQEKEEEEKRQEYRKKVAEKLAELNGSSWDIQISSNMGKGPLSGEDTLTFQDQKFSSEKASKEGWTATNYTITVPEEETAPIIWETMQTSEKTGVAFWRGEWKDESMSGVISRQFEDKSEEYTFTSSAMIRISPTSEEKEVSGETAGSDAPATLLISAK